ncbi:alpha/beta hydrolase [Actinomadura sp. ATCC 31491]|uniref:Alpha/beta hydrolase n=1 Tax=Actinomadura luzonensis TaxID=2805427 RepID=A0ABT0FTI1_9ACTN|nr:alpha/beta hydrolase [Actinomadura luzonensis]MCK2215645.1 alpha/beta hydrolase [Actinomadura luzonensis]
MTTFALIHGGGGSAYDWHLLEAELRGRGHDTVAVDLPVHDPDATLWDYADAVARAVGERRRPVVVAHSWGGFVGPLVCARLDAAALVLVTAMIPSPGESPDDWWERSGRPPSGIDDDNELYWHDVPRELAERVAAHDRALAAGMSMERAGREPWPLAAWPDVPTTYLLCRDDRLFPPAFVRRHAEERLGLVPEEMPGGHMVMLSRPADLAGRLARIAAS